MEYISRNRTFHKCISNARTCSAGEAAEYYRLAVMLDPFSEEGYLGLIRCLKDGGNKTGDAGLLREAFSAAEYDRSVRNIENLKVNKEGYEKVLSALSGQERQLLTDRA